MSETKDRLIWVAMENLMDAKLMLEEGDSVGALDATKNAYNALITLNNMD